MTFSYFFSFYFSSEISAFFASSLAGDVGLLLFAYYCSPCKMDAHLDILKRKAILSRQYAGCLTIAKTAFIRVLCSASHFNSSVIYSGSSLEKMVTISSAAWRLPYIRKIRNERPKQRKVAFVYLSVLRPFFLICLTVCMAKKIRITHLVNIKKRFKPENIKSSVSLRV